MPGQIGPKDGTHTWYTADHERRLRRHVAPLAPERIPFSYPGALALSTSPPWVPVRDVTLYDVRALLGTAGTSSTVVTVYVNGVSVGTVTLTSGQTNVGASLTSTALAADTDLVTVAVTTVGTGAKDLDVLVRVA